MLLLRQSHIKTAQVKQKQFHDHKSKDPKISIGDRVIVYFPLECLERAYKFCRPFRGPYQVVKVFPNGAEVTSLSDHKTQTIRVALDQVRHYPKELGKNPEESCAGTLEERYKDNATKGINCGGDPIPAEARDSGGNEDTEARSEDQIPGICCSQWIKKWKKPIMS